MENNLVEDLAEEVGAVVYVLSAAVGEDPPDSIILGVFQTEEWANSYKQTVEDISEEYFLAITKAAELAVKLIVEWFDGLPPLSRERDTWETVCRLSNEIKEMKRGTSTYEARQAYRSQSYVNNFRQGFVGAADKLGLVAPPELPPAIEWKRTFPPLSGYQMGIYKVILNDFSPVMSV